MRALRLLLSSALVLALCTGTALAAGTARTSYERAVARERSLTTRGTKAPTIAELRRLLASFERIAYIYPTSGLADNALQKAAKVAEQIYARTKADADRATAVRLYTWLAREYPASSLAKAARASARSLEPPQRARSSSPEPRPRHTATSRPPVTTDRIVPAAASLSPAPPPAAAVAVPSEPGEPEAPLAPSAASAMAPALPQLREVRRAVLPEVVRITLELDAEVGYRHERLEGPARLFFDLQGTSAAPHLRDAVLSWPDDVVRQVRLGRPAPEITRVVLDLEGTRRYSVFTLYNPYRLVVDLERTDGPRAGLRPSALPPSVTPDVQGDPLRGQAATASTSVLLEDIDLEPAPPAPPVDPREIDGRDQRLTEEVTLASRPVGALSDAPVPAVLAGGRQGSAASPAAKTPPAPPRQASAANVAGTSAAAPRAPSANATGGFSLSRQLGLGVSRIVIDPGHGGRDPGAMANGLSEADLVLDVALRLEKLLARSGVEVVLTRRTDAYVALEERTAIANREQADLFLSIHANASRNRHAHGVETYFLNFATSPEAEAVAARENSASERTMHNLPDIVKAIATNNKLHESRDLAGMVQESMVKRLSSKSRPVRNLGVKQAPFVVLIGAAMPSVLAEISFLTNTSEAQLLKSGSHRQRIAEALHEAVAKYQRSLKAVGTVAEQ